MIPTSTDVSIQLKDEVPGRRRRGRRVRDRRTAKTPRDVAGAARRETRRAVERLFDSGVVRGKAKELVFDLRRRRGKGKCRAACIVAGLGKPRRCRPRRSARRRARSTRAVRKHRLDASRSCRRCSRIAGTSQRRRGASSPAFCSPRSTTASTRARRREEGRGRRKPARLERDDRRRRDEAARAPSSAPGSSPRGRTSPARSRRRPGNDINPPTLAKVAQQLAREVGLDCPRARREADGASSAWAASSPSAPAAARRRRG